MKAHHTGDIIYGDILCFDTDILQDPVILDPRPKIS